MQAALEDGKEDIGQPPAHGVVSALAQALCHINRLGQLTATAAGIEDEKKATGRGYRSRILVISASPDSSSQYVAMMNCIFGAQKKVCRSRAENEQPVY